MRMRTVLLYLLLLGVVSAAGCSDAEDIVTIQGQDFKSRGMRDPAKGSKPAAGVGSVRR